MANYCNNSVSETFVEQAKYWFEKSHPSWRESVNKSASCLCETICIPDSLDILPNRRLETHYCFATKLSEETAKKSDFESGQQQKRAKLLKQAFKRDMVGQLGEDKFFIAFRKLKIGGILISGFNTQEFISKMNKENVTDIDYRRWKEEKRHFECDAIFIHNQLGVLIIETKGCDNGKVMKRCNEAANQLEKRIQGMKDIFRQITGRVCPLEFFGVICIPNAVVSLSHNHMNYKVLGKLEIESPNFRKFWIPDSFKSAENYFHPITDEVFSFIATIAGYRSTKFVNSLTNALEIYRIIDQQDFSRVSKQRNTACYPDPSLQLQSIKPQSIILNKEQLCAVECKEQHLIISGPPGTGKTVVLLIKALEAAKQEKPGRVIIISGHLGIELKHIFQKFIAHNQTDLLKREINIIEQLTFSLPRNNLEDDIFCDEMPTDDIFLPGWFGKETVWGKTSNSEVTGTTLIILSGRWNPEELAKKTTSTLTSYFPHFHHIELKTVIRGTISVINDWKHFFPTRFFKIGHNVIGTPVERIAVSGRFHIMATVFEKVSNLLNSDRNDNFCFGISPHHIAILVSYKRARMQDMIVSDIKNHLNNQGFMTGGFAQQINDKNLIAIGDPIEAISLDWPAVVYISGFDHIDDLIACSRCISKLMLLTNNSVGPLTRSRPYHRTKRDRCKRQVCQFDGTVFTKVGGGIFV